MREGRREEWDRREEMNEGRQEGGVGQEGMKDCGKGVTEECGKDTGSERRVEGGRVSHSLTLPAIQ